MTPNRSALRTRSRLLPFILVGGALLLGCAARNAVEPAVESDPVPSKPATDESTPIRVQISDEERAQLQAQITGDLGIAREVAAARPSASALAEEQRQRWDTLAHYIEQAALASTQKELRAAAELALKARLLAEELRPR